MYQSSPSRHKDKNWEAEEPSADQKSLANEDGDEPPIGVDFKRKNPKNITKLQVNN